MISINLVGGLSMSGTVRDLDMGTAGAILGAIETEGLIRLEQGAVRIPSPCEYRMLEAAVTGGALDANSGTVIMRVDGTSVQANQAIVTLLRELARNALRKQHPGCFPPRS